MNGRLLSPQHVVHSAAGKVPLDRPDHRWSAGGCGKPARQHYKPWEPFEFDFLCDYNVNHELATWARITIVFAEFLKLHPP